MYERLKKTFDCVYNGFKVHRMGNNGFDWRPYADLDANYHNCCLAAECVVENLSNISDNEIKAYMDDLSRVYGDVLRVAKELVELKHYNGGRNSYTGEERIGDADMTFGNYKYKLRNLIVIIEALNNRIIAVKEKEKQVSNIFKLKTEPKKQTTKKSEPKKSYWELHPEEKRQLLLDKENTAERLKDAMNRLAELENLYSRLKKQKDKEIDEIEKHMSKISAIHFIERSRCKKYIKNIEKRHEVIYTKNIETKKDIELRINYLKERISEIDNKLSKK